MRDIDMHALVRLSVDGEGQLWLLEDNLDLSVADELCQLTHLYLETPCLPFDCEAKKLDWLKRVTFPKLQVLQISIRYDYWLDDVQLLLQWAVNIRHLILDVYHECYFMSTVISILISLAKLITASKTDMRNAPVTTPIVSCLWPSWAICSPCLLSRAYRH